MILISGRLAGLCLACGILLPGPWARAGSTPPLPAVGDYQFDGRIPRPVLE